MHLLASIPALLLLLQCAFVAAHDCPPATVSPTEPSTEYGNDQPTVSPTELPTEPGDVQPASTATTKIFVLIPNAVNWFGADRFCKLNGMALATVNNQQENDLLLKFMEKQGVAAIWIGATDLSREGCYYWAGSGAALAYTAWGADQPQHHNNNLTENCVLVQEGGWHDYPCGDSFPFACHTYTSSSDVEGGRLKTEREYVQPTCSKETKKLFKIYSNEAGWIDAELECRANNSHLATVTNQEENETLHKMMKTLGVQDLWIGANDLSNEGRFTWVANGADVEYTAWDSDEPNNLSGVENCVHIRPDGTWNDKPCAHKYHFVCET